MAYSNIKLMRVKFTRSCLRQPKFTHTHKTIVNIYIVYELGASFSNDNDPPLKHCLFGAVTLNKTSDIVSRSILVMELDLIEDQVFISRCWIRSKCINFWSRYEFFCPY